MCLHDQHGTGDVQETASGHVEGQDFGPEPHRFVQYPAGLVSRPGIQVADDADLDVAGLVQKVGYATADADEDADRLAIAAASAPGPAQPPTQPLDLHCIEWLQRAGVAGDVGNDAIGDGTAKLKVLILVEPKGCQDGGICYMPLTREIDLVAMTVSDTDGGAPALNGGVWSTGNTANAPAASPSIEQNGGNLVSDLLATGGTFWVIGGFVLFGLLLSFTPCVFPMYPIMAGALARQGDKLSPARGFGLSLTYVVFLALAFGMVGAIAGWTGQNLQMALQSPITIGAIAALFVILSLSMFGAYELNLPSGWTTGIGKLTGGLGNSYGSMALLGFSSALIIGPCVTAPLAGALVYIAQTQDWVLGATALFALGIGKGIPLILLSTFGSGILPRAGAWMNGAKIVFGFAFLATAILVATPLMPMGLDLALWAALAIFAAVSLFGSARSSARGGLQIAGQAAALSVGLYGAILAIGAASGGIDPVSPLAHLTAGANPSQQAGLQFAEVDDEGGLETSLRSASSSSRSSSPSPRTSTTRARASACCR